MVTTLPRVHVCITGIEKVIPTLEDFATLLAAAAALGDRSADLELRQRVHRAAAARATATGRSTCTSSWSTRAAPICVGTDMQEMLRCIRCGACMNHCPVYKTVGGHAYGWVYPGPMGCGADAVLRRARERARPAARGDALQPVRRRVPGEASRCPTCCASCARSRSSGGCARGRERSALRALGLGGARSAHLRPRRRAGRRATCAFLGGGPKPITQLPFAGRAGRARATFPPPPAGPSASCTRSANAPERPCRADRGPSGSR